ncbi:MAG TPA: endonuclease III [Patescibacteria group bacterium]
MTKQKAYEIFDLLKKHYPHAKMILQWSNNWELLVSIILSAQCTDKKVNEVTSILFPKYAHTKDELKNEYKKYEKIVSLSYFEMIELVNFASVPITELEQDVKPTGFYHNKAKNVKTAAQKVLTSFKGILPKTITELITIPGVGRKTANVFLGNAYHIYEGIAVDTHVTKQAQILGLTKEKTPEKIEKDLMKLFDKKDWFTLTYLLIEHGRNMRKRKQDRTTCNDDSCLLKV